MMFAAGLTRFLPTLAATTSILATTSASWSQTPPSEPAGDEEPENEAADLGEAESPGAAESSGAPDSSAAPVLPPREADDSDGIPLLMRKPRAASQERPQMRLAEEEPAQKARPIVRIRYVTSEENEDAEEDDGKLPGMFLRVAPEYSRIRAPRRFKIETRSPGVAIDTEVAGSIDGPAPGGRVEMGYAVGLENKGAVVPRLGVALAVLPRQAYSRSILGIEHEFSEQPLWISAAPGVEIQFPYRFLAIGMDLGFGGVGSEVDSLTPEGSEPRDQARAGVLGRFAFVLRLPTTTAVGAGVYGSMEGFAFPGRDMWGTKTSVAFFVELDGSR